MDNMNFDPNTGEPVNQATSEEPVYQATSEEPVYQTTSYEPTEEKKKKSPVFIAIGIIALLVVLAGGAIVFAFNGGLFASDKDKVVKAFSKMLNSKEETPFEKEFLNELVALGKKSSTEQGFTLKLEDAAYEAGLPSYITDFQINLESASDAKGKKSSMLLGLEYGGATLADLEIYADESDIMLAAPQLTDTVLTVNYADDLRGQIEDSPLLSEIYDEYEESFEAFFDALDEMKDSSSNDKKVLDGKEMYEAFQKSTKAITALTKAMEVNKIASKEFTVNGKTAKCTGYEVSIAEEDIVDFIDEFQDFYLNSKFMEEVYWSNFAIYDSFNGLYDGMSPYGSSYTESMKESMEQMFQALKDGLTDINMTVYLTRGGNIAYMELDTVLISAYGSDSQVNLQMTFLGGSSSFENVEGVLTLSDDYEDVKMVFDKTGSYEKNIIKTEFNLSVETDGNDPSTIQYTGEYNVKSGAYGMDLVIVTNDYGYESSVELNCEGIVTLNKGKSVEVDIDSFLIIADDEEIMELSGSFYIKELSKEITAPEGDMMDAISADETDWQYLFIEVIGELQSIMDDTGIDIY